MIGILFSNAASEAGRYVTAAMRRSVSGTQAQAVSLSALRSSALDMVVAISPPDEWGAELLEWVRARPRKLMLFGRVPAALASHFGCRPTDLPAAWPTVCSSEPAPSGEMRQSPGEVLYGTRARLLGARAWRRPMERFDFTDEWNNLGYGAVRGDGSIWGLVQAVHVAAEVELAALIADETPICSYAALADTEAASVLWFNREVGPCDSFEWRIVEAFVSGYRHDVLPCCPVLCEIPAGFDAAITSRLDCDEDVESARPLWQAYQRLGVPFTLAVHTRNLDDAANHRILRELLADGGAVLSHTATHAPNWGGSYEAALQEGRQSAAQIQSVTGRAVRYAVSPFHQSPPYALRALADAGYDGCVGGIIRNDPEFVLARGGALADVPEGFVGHSQQCMLHGDCMLHDGDALAVFKQAFDVAYATRTLFGYLDHPFSPRYQYGWPDEQTRIDAHEQLIAYIRASARNPLFMHEEAALDFVRFKSAARVVGTHGAFRIDLPPENAMEFSLAVEYRGALVAADSGVLLQ